MDTRAQRPRLATDGVPLKVACERIPQCREALAAPLKPVDPPTFEILFPRVVLGMAGTACSLTLLRIIGPDELAPVADYVGLAIIAASLLVLIVLPLTGRDDAARQRYHRRMRVYRRLRYFPDDDALFDPLTCRQEPATRANLSTLLDAG